MNNANIDIIPQSELGANGKEYLLVYNFKGKKFAYYPSSLDAIRADLAIEIEECEARRNHEVCISGYPVMTADFDDNVIKFAETETDSARGHFIACVNRMEFLKVLRLGMDRVIKISTN